jgi:hypothetical protein
MNLKYIRRDKMPSINKTENYGLNQWTGNEYPKRIDFVQDNLIVDGILKEHENAIEANNIQLEQLETGLTELSATATNTQQAVEEHYDYFTQQISTITATGIPKLVTIPLVVTANTDNQKVFQIPYDYYDKATDTLLVFQDGLALPYTFYSSTSAVESGGVVTKGNLTLVNGVVSGTILPLFILKNVPIGPNGSINGAILAQNTIPLDRLIGLAAAYIEKGNDYRPNLLINGDFQVWQRGASFTGAGGLLQYTADRWHEWSAGGYTEVSKDVDGVKWVTGGNNSLKQILEKTAQTQNRVMTFSIKVKGTAGSVIYLAIEDINTPTSGLNTVSEVGFTCTGGDDVFSINAPSRVYTNRIGVRITSYNSSTYLIKYAKLELNDHATPFIPKSYGEELALCQRYYRRLTGKSRYLFGGGKAYSNSMIQILVPVNVAMRLSTPSLSHSSLSLFYLETGSALISPPSSLVINGDTSSDTGALLQFDVTGATVGAYYFAVALNESAWIAFDAEI